MQPFAFHVITLVQKVVRMKMCSQTMASVTSHVLAMQSWNQCKQNKRLVMSIENHLDPTRCKQICNNRHYLKGVAETLLLTGHLEIAYHGHDESKRSLNRGIF